MAKPPAARQPSTYQPSTRLPPTRLPSTEMALHALATATDLLLASVDRLSGAAFFEPSLLPGWSRAHVLAHLALNARGLAGVHTTLGRPNPLPMYASNTRRDTDIDRLAAQPPAHIADRLAIGAAVLAGHLGGGPTPEAALETVGRARATTQYPARDSGAVIGVFAQAAAEARAAIATWFAAGTFERVPGGRSMSAAEIPLMRWREVEIHHADLDTGYRPKGWPAAFSDYLLGTAAGDRDSEIDAVLQPADGPAITLGNGGPVIEGAPAALAWWLIGRGSGEGLRVDPDCALPILGAWVRR